MSVIKAMVIGSWNADDVYGTPVFSSTLTEASSGFSEDKVYKDAQASAINLERPSPHVNPRRLSLSETINQISSFNESPQFKKSNQRFASVGSRK